MSISLPTRVLSGTVGNNLIVKAGRIKEPFRPICEKIDESKQFWEIQPNLPEGLSLDSASGVISGKSEEKINLDLNLFLI